MKRIIFAVLILMMVGEVQALDGVFDRSAEVEKYIGLMQTSTTGTLAVVSREISVSGISDPSLAAALNERFLHDYKTLGSERADATYGVWMARALASFGIDEYAATLKQVAAGSMNSKIRSASKDAMDDIAWNRAKNKIMASRKNFNEGDDPAISRLMNLLVEDDYSYKHYAAERMNWDKILDKRLMATIAPQVQSYVDRGHVKLTNEQEDTIANFIKLLGYSQDVQYRPLLESVLASNNSSAGVKRHAKYAVDKLF